ncbi:MAG: transporter [Pirellulales bacterium]
MRRFLIATVCCVLCAVPAAGFAQTRSFAARERLLENPVDRAESRDRAEDDEPDEIETDRDSFTPATTVVGLSRTVVESAYSFIDNRRVPETHSLPELVVRYGVTERLELRFGTNYEIGGAGNPISANIPDDLEDDATLEEEANVSYGLKYALTEQAEWIPTSAILLQAYTPVAGEATDTHFVATYVAGRTFANRWAWDSAIRYSTGSHEDDRFNVWSPSTVLKVPVGERWKAHIEYFGVFSDGRATESTQHFISPGAHYLITSNWEIGTRFGWGLNDQAPNFFVNVGGGYRF